MWFDHWDKRYLDLAQLVSSWSKDPNKQVGAVVTKGKTIKGIGFNGFPRPIQDTPERLENRELKNKLMIHAEVNAILAAKQEGDTIHIYPCLPCMQCLMLIMQTKIYRIVTCKAAATRETSWDRDLVVQICKEHNVSVKFI
jgi:dCMP deaminase